MSALSDAASAAKANAEFALAQAILLSVSKTIETTDRFATWFVAGSAGAAALMVSNIDGLLTVFTSGELRAALWLLVISTAVGLGEKFVAWLALNSRNVREAVLATFPKILAEHEKAEAQVLAAAGAAGKQVETGIDFRRVVSLASPGIPRAFHWAWNASVERGYKDRLSGEKALSRLCSYQWLLCLVQFVTGVAALVVTTVSFDVVAG